MFKTKHSLPAEGPAHQSATSPAHLLLVNKRRCTDNPKNATHLKARRRGVLSVVLLIGEFPRRPARLFLLHTHPSFTPAPVSGVGGVGQGEWEGCAGGGRDGRDHLQAQGQGGVVVVVVEVVGRGGG